MQHTENKQKSWGTLLRLGLRKCCQLFSSSDLVYVYVLMPNAQSGHGARFLPIELDPIELCTMCSRTLPADKKEDCNTCSLKARIEKSRSKKALRQ